MKSDTKQWLDIAKSDYESCLYLFKGAYYPQALYFICQAIEKVLKAAQVKFTSQVPKKIHQLESLAETTGLEFSADQKKFLEALAKDYGRIRYPDYGQTLYNTKTKVEPLIKRAEEVYVWILTKLENH